MAVLISVTELRTHIETDLVDAALTRILNDADDAIVEALGEHKSTGTVSEVHIGGDKALFFDRPYSAITSVTEHRGTTNTVLSEDDYRTWYGNRLLERLSLEATNPQANWGERVTVVYTPVDDDKQRIGATIDLVRLALQYTALKSQRAGDYSSSALDYDQERARIINRLNRKSLIPG